MSHMQPETYKGDYWVVETTAGTEIIPCAVESNPDNLAMFLEGDQQAPATKHHGWLARLTAPGYLDCTTWITETTEEGARAELARTYDLCSVCMNDDTEEHSCET